MEKKELDNEVLKDVVGGQQDPNNPGPKASINQSVCLSCGTCAANCPVEEAIFCEGSMYKIEPDLCLGRNNCRECEEYCPTCAIDWY